MTLIEQMAKKIAETEIVVEELDLARSKNEIYQPAYETTVNYLNTLRSELDVVQRHEEALRNPPPIPVQQPAEVPVSGISNEALDQLTTALQQRYDQMEDWLIKNGNNCKTHNLQNQPNSTQRVYFNYGYQTAIDEVLKLFGV